MGNTNLHIWPDAIDGPQDAPRSYKVHTDGIPFICPKANEKQNSAIWNSDIFQMNESASNPGNNKSANESSGAEGTARRTVDTGGGGTDMNMNGEKGEQAAENDNAFTAVNVYDMDSMMIAALDSVSECKLYMRILDILVLSKRRRSPSFFRNSGFKPFSSLCV
jgi:hypothetical protein